MGDDGVALKVLETIDKDIKKLMEDLNINKEIETIIGETDFIYCLDKVDDNDFVIVLDSTALGVNPGKVTVISFNEYKKHVSYASQHGLNLVNMLISYKKNVDGIIVGIEAYDIDFNFGISNKLNNMFSEICKSVVEEIMKVLKNLG